MTLQKIPTKDRKRQGCSSCGRPIMQLADFQSLIRFMEQTSAQRRGFQCMNCRQITCYECSNKISRCACGSNAWVATPYVESTAKERFAHTTA
ncbi:MAG: hypothetical protein PVG41_09775 [Desulfobacteraceae bacterium]